LSKKTKDKEGESTTTHAKAAKALTQRTQGRPAGRPLTPRDYAKEDQATQGQTKSDILDRIYMIYRIWLTLLNL
jgi:lysozyme family protein